jgi:acetyl-CoA acetyltransferase
VLQLCDRLNKTQPEIEELTVSEINEWFAFFKVKEDGRSKSKN